MLKIFVIKKKFQNTFFFQINKIIFLFQATNLLLKKFPENCRFAFFEHKYDIFVLSLKGKRFVKMTFTRSVTR